jgi:hypothetical protein
MQRYFMKKTTQTCRRNERGGALIQAVAMSAALVALVVGATYLIANVGMSFYYKQKIQYATRAAAQIAQDGTDPTAKVTQILQQMHLPPPTSINVRRTNAGTTVTLKEDGLQLFGDGSYVPATTSLTDTQSTEPFTDCSAYLRLEFKEQDGSPVGYPMIQPGAFCPILSQNQIDPSLPKFMFDTNEWPATQFVYHRVYSNFPTYR